MRVVASSATQFVMTRIIVHGALVRYCTTHMPKKKLQLISGILEKKYSSGLFN